MDTKNQAASLLQNASAVSVQGRRSLTTRPFLGLATSALLVAGSTLPLDAQARDLRWPSTSQTSAKTYDVREAGRAQQVKQGEIVAIRPVHLQAKGGLNAGTIVGAVLGGVAGNQVGGGSGRRAATVGGTVLGGALGQKIQQRRGNENGVELTIRVQERRGSRLISVVQNNDVRFGLNEPVFLVGSNRNLRVVPITPGPDVATSHQQNHKSSDIQEQQPTAGARARYRRP